MRVRRRQHRVIVEKERRNEWGKSGLPRTNDVRRLATPQRPLSAPRKGTENSSRELEDHSHLTILIK